MPPTGITWCECGEDHELRRPDVVARYRGRESADGRIPHEVVIDVTRDAWGYVNVCRFFHLAIEDSATIVAGAVLPSYEVRDAVDITGVFSKSWHGCPEEGCTGA